MLPAIPNFRTLMFLSVFLCFVSACGEDSSSDSTDDESTEYEIYYSELSDLSDWTEATHEKLDTEDIIDNLDVVFDLSKVQTLRIVIESENWTVMNEELADLTDELGGSTDYTSIDNPSFVPSEVFYRSDDSDEWTEWYKVGVRFKGNSSLYSAGNSKLPFKLDFDEFEDEYPDIKNQRFYGFKQLNLKNNYDDESEMHEVAANELFRDFGLVTAHSSFYALYLNVDGSGSEENDIYYGLYTLVEEVDDTVIETQFDDDDGNLYKPEDDAATFASGTYDEDEYGLKTDDDETYADITELYEAINDSDVGSDTWISNLESIFDVNTFLKWLAANVVMQNWDSYGVMPHNYYLYNDPDDGTFKWIPWDHNEALVDDNKALSMTMYNLDSGEWPLIENILEVTDYNNTYQSYIQSFAQSYLNEDESSSFNLNDSFETYKTLIQEYVEAEGDDYTFTSASEFSSAVETLESHTTERYNSAQNYVGWTD